MTQVMDLFSSNGGTQIAAAVEAFAQSEFGANIMSKRAKSKPTTSKAAPKAKVRPKAKPKPSTEVKPTSTVTYKPET